MWDPTHHSSNASFWKKRNDKTERNEIYIKGGEILPTQVSIKLIFRLMRMLEQFNIEQRKWQGSILWMRQSTFGSFLWCAWVPDESNSTSFLLPSFSQTLCIYVLGHMYMSIRVCVCLNCGFRTTLYFSILFFWAAQTMNSHDSVSISRLTKSYWEWENYIFSGVYTWSEALKLYKIIAVKSIFVTEHKDPGGREKQL